ncbi:hypothetical protein ACFO3O_14160 [Dokdonia ponticola]|uniref:T9SS type A sorting domain-containing protein n=1 Tax=Dokdonia ponticola TaxID=2041041 RepID=A0ABV9HZY1_9FLAO
MKNTLKLALLFTLLVTSVHVNATGSELFTDEKKPTIATIDTDRVIREKGEKVSINLLNLDLNPVHIIIRDGRGRIVFSETITNDETIQKSFSFTKAFKGNYSIKVKDGSTTYTKEIEII